MVVKKQTLIKTYIADTIAATLEKEAERKGLTFLEYIRVVLGEHALQLKEKQQVKKSS
jgi:hypothetical protein